ncbi:MarR family winged helix-turn-helix transcriptional regulator [Aurantimonas sp. A2-1-M11]|uniref:MarR family winged helix-turn-helix transcriptional regulator n=1 Tax=Aurantimonas sp. A2-1-M11 TaxID=3113712 RepID=UPI002F9267A2
MDTNSQISSSVPTDDPIAIGMPVLVPSLLSIAKSTRAFLALLLADIGLHPGQDQLLDQLDPLAPVSVSALAAQLCVRPSTVSKMLDRLIEKGLVERSTNSSDARRTMVHLTSDGERVQATVRGVWQRLEVDLAHSLSEEELEVLQGSLARTGDLLAQKLRRLR